MQKVSLQSCSYRAASASLSPQAEHSNQKNKTLIEHLYGLEMLWFTKLDCVN